MNPVGAKASKKTKAENKPLNVPVAEKRRIEKFLETAKTVMRLNDWDIKINWEKNSGKEALASIEEMPYSKHATIMLSQEFLSLDEAARRQTLLHELMHCHVFPLQRLGEEVAEKVLKKDALAVFNAAHCAQVETLVDTLADVLAGLMDD